MLKSDTIQSLSIFYKIFKPKIELQIATFICYFNPTFHSDPILVWSFRAIYEMDSCFTLTFGRNWSVHLSKKRPGAISQIRVFETSYRPIWEYRIVRFRRHLMLFGAAVWWFYQTEGSIQMSALKKRGFSRNLLSKNYPCP